MTITGFEDVEEMLNKLANPYEMAEKAVNKAAPIVEKNLKTQIRSAANRRDKYGKPYSTGELEVSIAATNARDNSLGVFAVVKTQWNCKKVLEMLKKWVIWNMV